MQKRAFSLIELLTVIAVIGILAAIIFPVFARARAEAYRSGDLSSMSALRNAVLLYREDQGGYPPQLLGYATMYSSGANAGAVIPADKISSYLYPRRVSGIDTFRPANNRVSLDQVTTATWPNADPADIGKAPQYDLNGDGQIDLGTDDPEGARQAFRPTNGCAVQLHPNQTDSSCDDHNGSALFYTVSGYDVARYPFPRSGGSIATDYELRYALFWTNWGLGANGFELGSGTDDPRQLGYNNPPDDAIITWNTWWRDYEDGNTFSYEAKQPVAGRRDVVLTVGGAARPADSKGLYRKSWRFQP